MLAFKNVYEYIRNQSRFTTTQKGRHLDTLLCAIFEVMLFAELIISAYLITAKG